MEQASAWHRCMVPQVATLATWWEFHIPAQSAASKNQRPQVATARGSENYKHKMRTAKNQDRTTLGGKTVEFSEFWSMKALLHEKANCVVEFFFRVLRVEGRRRQAALTSRGVLLPRVAWFSELKCVLRILFVHLTV